MLGIQSLSNEALLAKCIISDSRLVAESRRFVFKAVTLKQNKPTAPFLVREKCRVWCPCIAQNEVLQNWAWRSPRSRNCCPRQG